MQTFKKLCVVLVIMISSSIYYNKEDDRCCRGKESLFLRLESLFHWGVQMV